MSQLITVSYNFANLKLSKPSTNTLVNESSAFFINRFASGVYQNRELNEYRDSIILGKGKITAPIIVWELVNEQISEMAEEVLNFWLKGYFSYTSLNQFRDETERRDNGTIDTTQSCRRFVEALLPVIYTVRWHCDDLHGFDPWAFGKVKTITLTDNPSSMPF